MSTCAYCGGSAQLTREHVFPSWVRDHARSLGFVRYAPVLGRHASAGEAVITDVCRACNNGRLSQLDSAAKAWFEAERTDLTQVPTKGLPETALWAAKLAFNEHRLARKKGTDFGEPEMPPNVGLWILNPNISPEPITVCLASLPPKHPSASNFFSISHFRKPELACMFVALMGCVFYVHWDHPNSGVTAVAAAQRFCRELGAVLVAHSYDSPFLDVPVFRFPEFVEPARGDSGFRTRIARASKRM